MVDRIFWHLMALCVVPPIGEQRHSNLDWRNFPMRSTPSLCAALWPLCAMPSQTSLCATPPTLCAMPLLCSTTNWPHFPSFLQCSYFSLPNESDETFSLSSNLCLMLFLLCLFSGGWCFDWIDFFNGFIFLQQREMLRAAGNTYYMKWL